MKVLVLGGHGFVGGHLCRALDGSEHTVIPRSRRDGQDLRDLDQARQLLQETRPDAIFNCAAHVGSVHYVSARAASVFEDNVRMALNLYRAVAEVCPQARLINPLSNCSYPGDADIHYEPDWWKGEVHDSVLSYGNSRRFLYVLARCYAIEHGVRTVNFLVPNTFGPGDSTDPNRTHALNGMIIRMLHAQREQAPCFEIWGTGKPVREWGYIDDVVAILKQGLALEADLTYPVNIAQNRGHSVRESAQLIAQAVGFAGELVFNPKYQDGALRKVLDDRKFRVLFPDFRFTDHEVGIRRTVDYYRSVLAGA